MLTWNLTLCDYCHESTRLEHGSSATVAAGRLKELEPGKGAGSWWGHTRCTMARRPRAWLASKEARSRE